MAIAIWVLLLLLRFLSYCLNIIGTIAVIKAMSASAVECLRGNSQEYEVVPKQAKETGITKNN